jgi:hypothetical protein
MSHSQFHSTKLFILRHAWLNLWDKHMTTGRINQVTLVNKENRTENRKDGSSYSTLYSSLQFLWGNHRSGSVIWIDRSISIARDRSHWPNLSPGWRQVSFQTPSFGSTSYCQTFFFLKTASQNKFCKAASLEEVQCISHTFWRVATDPERLPIVLWYFFS